MILAAAFYFGALTAAFLAVGYLGHDLWLDWNARRRKAARQRSDEHVKALSRLRTGGRTFPTIRAAQTARARNGAAPARPLLLTWPTRSVPIVRPVSVPARFMPWPQTWAEPPLPMRGFGPTYAEIREVPSWAR